MKRKEIKNEERLKLEFSMFARPALYVPSVLPLLLSPTYDATSLVNVINYLSACIRTIVEIRTFVVFDRMRGFPVLYCQLRAANPG